MRAPKVAPSEGRALFCHRWIVLWVVACLLGADLAWPGVGCSTYRAELAWNPRDGMLYVPAISFRGNGVYAYNSRTTSQVRYLPVEGNEHPSLISIEA